MCTVRLNAELLLRLGLQPVLPLCNSRVNKRFVFELYSTNLARLPLVTHVEVWSCRRSGLRMINEEVQLKATLVS